MTMVTRKPIQRETQTSEYPHVAAGMKYALDIVSGVIPSCKYVRLACQRHIDDLLKAETKAFPYYYDSRAGERICRFIENLPHIKGKWANTLIRLEPWQCFILSVLFGWRRKKDDMRRFRELYLEVPRKNAKSTLAAGMGLYMFVEDGEPGAEIYSGATTEKQAWEVFRPARLMALKADGFREHYGIQVNASNLAIIDTASKFEPIIGDPGDGSSPHCSITDEFHEHKSPVQYDSMTTGMGARTQPLELIITTAGVNLAGPCYQKRDEIIKTLEGTLDNPDIFGIIYTIDDDDDWTDFENWKKANPNYGVSVDEDYLRARHRIAMHQVSKQNIIRCKHLNQWMNADVAYFEMMKWRKCYNPNLKIEDMAGKRCFIFIDLASRNDLAAMVILFKHDGDDDRSRYSVFANFYLPEDVAEYGAASHYDTWAKEGWITLTPGDTTDFRYIRDDLIKMKSQYEIVELPYDPFQATMFSTEMNELGFPMVEYGATVRNFSEPMKELDAVIREGRIEHDGNPVLGWNLSNVVAHYDKKDNVFPNKEIQENKIDGAVALIGALARAMTEQNTSNEVGIEVW